MKKITILISLILIYLLGACSQTKLTELRISGTKNHTLYVGNSLDLLDSVYIISNTGDNYLDELIITSENCEISSGVISSEVAIICNVTYYIEVKNVIDQETIIVTFAEDYQDLEIIESYNNLRIYQIYVSAYQNGIPGGYEVGYGPSNHDGDLQGIINALDYIESLGVNAIWLTPIFESKYNNSHSEYEIRGRSTGYFADDYYNIDPNFGTNELFRTLVEEVHDRGMYIFLDGVFGHHGSFPIEGVVDGKTQWYGHETVYPDSLDFFIDVATYWIEEYEIDGWRLDQAYQLYQFDYNYFRDIRIAVEELSLERKERGETWGTLGYMVAEVWDEPNIIQQYAYDQNAFRSAFDFPTQLQLIRSLTTTEDVNSILEAIDYAISYEYSDYAQPNLFISNHDMPRLGDLLEISNLDHQYFERHKLAFSFLAAYTGPITIYYGDEYGDEFEGLSEGINDLNIFPYIAQDNVGRTNGRINEFSEEQEDLIDYVSNLMIMRNTYDSLWNGRRDNLFIGNNILIDLKTSENNQILYVFNLNENNQEITVFSELFSGSILRNLFTNELTQINDGQVTIQTNSLEAMFFIIED